MNKALDLSVDYNRNLDNKTWLEISALWLNLHGANLLNFIGDLGLTVTGVLITISGNDYLKPGCIVFYVFALVSIIGNFLVWKKNDDFKELKEKNRILNERFVIQEKVIEGYTQMSFDIIRNQLAYFASDIFQLTDTERISIYLHIEKGFNRVGRYSKNPDYKGNGRFFIPENEGCISQAWKCGEVFIDNLPDPQSNLRGWLKTQRTNFSVDRSIARKLSMKSRCFYAVAIDDPEKKERFAVLVIESTEINKLKKDELKKQFSESEYERLSELIFRMKDVLPDPEIAPNKGF